MSKFIKVYKANDGVWIRFIGADVEISLDSIVKKSGPIVQKNLKQWAREIPYGMPEEREEALDE